MEKILGKNMAKVFLDTNCFIDAIHRTPEKQIIKLLEGYTTYISPLSVHILCYTFKIKTPKKELSTQVSKFQLVEFSQNITQRALKGPAKDFEDNVQLHSAAEAECDYFLTQDKKLLSMKFFGKVQIITPEKLE